METYMFILLVLSLVMTLAPAGAWAGQIAVLISLADLVMLHRIKGRCEISQWAIGDDSK